MAAASVFGPEGGTWSTVEELSGAGARVDFYIQSSFCENLPVASGAVDSAAGNGEVSGSGRISLACGADGVARSNGTLGRPRKGMVSEKRLADGLKEDKF
jgi:hypothetical protein